MFGYKTPLKALSFIFILVLLTPSLHAKQKTTVIRVVDGDTLNVTGGKDENKQ